LGAHFSVVIVVVVVCHYFFVIVMIDKANTTAIISMFDILQVGNMNY